MKKLFIKSLFFISINCVNESIKLNLNFEFYKCPEKEIPTTRYIRNQEVNQSNKGNEAAALAILSVINIMYNTYNTLERAQSEKLRTESIFSALQSIVELVVTKHQSKKYL